MGLNLLYLLLHILSTPRHATVTLTHPQWQDILVDLDLEQVVHLVPNHSQHRHLPTCPLTNKEITLVSSFSNVSKIHTLTPAKITGMLLEMDITEQLNLL